MPYVSAAVAYGIMLATAGLIVAGCLVVFMVLLRDDGPKIGGERDPALLGWPVGPMAEPTSQDDAAKRE